MKHSMIRFALTGLVSLMMIGGLLASCQLFDHDNDALTMPTSEGGQTGNFIIGAPEISGWGGYYHRNNTFFAINVPVVGALNISYTIQNGGGYALFVETPGATKMEIGLNTINGVTDVLDSVCVSYAEGVTAFTSVPAGVVKATQHGATHYRRKHDAGESDWWPLDAAFAFGVADAQVKTVCVMQNGALGMTEISGPFPKAAPVTPVTTAYAITATAGANGTISPNGDVAVNKGASRTFTITPNAGYSIQDVTVDGASVGAVATYAFTNVTAPHIIAATFMVTPPDTYTITATAGANGGISPSGAVTVNKGASQSFTITPNTGYAVQDVLVDGVSQGAIGTYTFTNVTTGPHTITASFTPACGGIMVGGFCWRVTALYQSCQDLCSGFGNYNTSALNFWATGTQTQCETILLHFGHNLDAFATIPDIQYGCYRNPLPGTDICYIANGVPQNITASFNANIACACNN